MKPPFKVGDTVYKDPTAFHSNNDPTAFVITAIESDPEYEGGFKVKTKPPMSLNHYVEDYVEGYVTAAYFVKHSINEDAEILEVF